MIVSVLHTDHASRHRGTDRIACKGLQFNSNGNLCYLKGDTIYRSGLLVTRSDNGPFIAYRGLTCQQTASLDAFLLIAAYEFVLMVQPLLRS
jgi:hypothetical protein